MNLKELPKVKASNKPFCYMAYCTFCSDKSGHCEVDLQKQVYHCHRCGKGGRVYDTNVSGGTSYCNDDISITDKKDIPTWKQYISDVIIKGERHWNYLNDRGLDSSHIVELAPRYGLEWWRIYFPVWDRESNFVYVAARALDDNEIIQPKWWFPSGRPGASSYLWGIHRIKEESNLVLVEGIFDAVWDTNRVCTFGTTISDEQIRQIIELRPQSITVAYDGTAVKESVKAAGKIAKAYSCKVYYSGLDGKSDPDNLRYKGSQIIENTKVRIQ